MGHYYHKEVATDTPLCLLGVFKDEGDGHTFHAKLDISWKDCALLECGFEEWTDKSLPAGRTIDDPFYKLGAAISKTLEDEERAKRLW
jgi:hypothetical protein